MKYLIDVKNLAFKVKVKNTSGKSEDKAILKDISFGLKNESILGIAGESGSGKTTLAKIIAGIFKQTSGTIEFNFLRDWGQKKTNPIQILFQNNGEILNPLRTINEIIAESTTLKSGNRDSESKQNILDAVNLTEKLWNRKGFELSGGEQQRAALARILSVQPEVLILDEPFSAQDPISQVNLMSLLRSLNTNLKVTMICISHNIKILRALCDEIIVMYKGEIVEMGNAKNTLDNPRHPYTKFLLRAEDYNLTYDEIQNELEFLKE